MESISPGRHCKSREASLNIGGYEGIVLVLFKSILSENIRRELSYKLEESLQSRASSFEATDCESINHTVQMDGFIDENKVVLRVVIENMLYPITIDVIKMVSVCVWVLL